MDPSAINDPFADRDDQSRTFIKPDPRGRGATTRPAGETSGIDVAAPEAIPDVGLPEHEPERKERDCSHSYRGDVSDDRSVDRFARNVPRDSGVSLAKPCGEVDSWFS